MLLVRGVSATLLAAAAIIVWFAAAPAQTQATAPDFGPSIAAAIADYSVNNSSTDSAPQQQVVNGWVAKDLLTVLAKEQQAALNPVTAPRDNRVPLELLLVVVGVALLAGMSTFEAHGASPEAATFTGIPAAATFTGAAGSTVTPFSTPAPSIPAPPPPPDVR